MQTERPTAKEVRGQLDRGMEAQLRNFRHALNEGMPRLGWKIGINDPRMLERLGLAEPAIGWLAGDRAMRSGDRYVLRRGTRVFVEAEIALHVGGGAVSLQAPALELVNFSLPANSLEGALEHNIYHEAVVLGAEVPPVSLDGSSWPHLYRNGTEVSRREPKLLAMDPGAVLRHVSGLLARYGEWLEAGDWIIAGSLIQPLSVRAGDKIEADFGPLGKVAVEVAE
ncbi:MAG TPA: hypothetical protein VMS22_01505 [Candidatus Eisenbacteria bacterium]|nr:hypothetical protein [Candidatus Eisenbacteria bacterium]